MTFPALQQCNGSDTIAGRIFMHSSAYQFKTHLEKASVLIGGGKKTRKAPTLVGFQQQKQEEKVLLFSGWPRSPQEAFQRALTWFVCDSPSLKEPLFSQFCAHAGIPIQTKQNRCLCSPPPDYARPGKIVLR